jgi:hypothetical protein
MYRSSKIKHTMFDNHTYVNLLSQPYDVMLLLSGPFYLCRKMAAASAYAAIRKSRVCPFRAIGSVKSYAKLHLRQGTDAESQQRGYAKVAALHRSWPRIERWCGKE